MQNSDAAHEVVHSEGPCGPCDVPLGKVCVACSLGMKTDMQVGKTQLVKDRSANGTSASDGRAGRITRSNSWNRSGWMRPDRGGAEVLPVHTEGQICLVSADRS